MKLKIDKLINNSGMPIHTYIVVRLREICKNLFDFNAFNN